MCQYFCIGFIDFMLKGKTLLEYINLFFPNEYEKNDRIISKYFHLIYYLVCDKYKKLKNPLISYLFKIILGLSIVCSNCGNKYKKFISLKK